MLAGYGQGQHIGRWLQTNTSLLFRVFSKRQKKEAKNSARTRQTWEVFIEIAGPCSSSHLRTQAPLCSLRDLSSSKQQLCRDLYSTGSYFKALFGVCEGGVYVCLLPQLDRRGLGGKGAAFLSWMKRMKRWKGTWNVYKAKGIFWEIHLFSGSNYYFLFLFNLPIWNYNGTQESTKIWNNIYDTN